LRTTQPLLDGFFLNQREIEAEETLRIGPESKQTRSEKSSFITRLVDVTRPKSEHARKPQSMGKA
jgi:hypothetical protein